MNDELEAFNNFFFDYMERRKNGENLPAWGEDYWKQWGVDVWDSKVVFYTAKHRTLFMLRWR